MKSCRTYIWMMSFEHSMQMLPCSLCTCRKDSEKSWIEKKCHDQNVLLNNAGEHVTEIHNDIFNYNFLTWPKISGDIFFIPFGQLLYYHFQFVILVLEINPYWTYCWYNIIQKEDFSTLAHNIHIYYIY